MEQHRIRREGKKKYFDWTSDLVAALASEISRSWTVTRERDERQATGIAHRHAESLASTDDIAEVASQYGRVCHG